MDAQRRHARLLAGAAIVGGACWVIALIPTWHASADLGHAWLAPLLAAYLWWERWEERPVLRPAGQRPRWAAALMIGLAVLAVPLRLQLTPYPLWPMASITFTAVFAGLALVSAAWLAGRPGLRWIGGPLLLTLSCLPLPSRLETAWIVPLREGMAVFTAELCNVLGRPAIASGTSIQLANTWVGVEEACSGIRSLQACAMMGLFFGEWFRFSAGRRALLVTVGLLAALAGNFGRVVFLSLAATRSALTLDATHDAAGWIAMLGSLAATGWLAFAWGGYRMPETTRIARPVSPFGPLPVPLFAATLIVIAADLGTRAWYFRGNQAQESVPQWTARFPAEHWSFHARPLAKAAREMLRPDHYVAGGWRQGDAQIESYYIEWQSGQVARSVPFLHNPTVCLPYSGCELVATLPPIAVPWERGTVDFFVYRFRRLGDELLVAFTIWDPARGRLLQRQDSGRGAEWWRSQWRDVIEARQHQPAQLLAVSVRYPAGDTEGGPSLQESAVLSPIIAQLLASRP